MAFLAASTFLEALALFDRAPVDPDVVEKVRYARYRAKALLHAVRVGEPPVPPPAAPGPLPPLADPAAPDAPNTAGTTTTDAALPLLLPDPPTGIATVAVSRVPVAQPVGSATRPPPPHPAVTPQPPPAFDPRTFSTMTAAEKHCKYAVSALQYEDVDTAIENLQRALHLLLPMSKRHPS